MMKNNNYCVIMAGGIGSRFWPFSRNSRPKQFLDFFGTGRSLLQMTVDRFRPVVPIENVLIVTNVQYKELVMKQIPDLQPSQVLCEPARRNTAPCIAYATAHIKGVLLQRAIAEGKMAKEYYAVVRGEPENKSGILEDLLFKDSSKNKSFVVKRMRKGVKKASLEYETQKTLTDGDKKYSLVKIKLHTGRTHQIRAHLAEAGYPLIGDRKYGDPKVNAMVGRRFNLNTQLLHACRIEFGECRGIFEYLSGRKFVSPPSPEFMRITRELTGIDI